MGRDARRSVPRRMLALEPLAGRASTTTPSDWPGIAALAPARDRARRATARSCCRSGRCSPRSRRRGDDARRDRAGDHRDPRKRRDHARRRAGLRHPVPPAGLGATLGYIVAGALIGPQVLGLDRRSRAAHQRHRNRHRAAAVHRRARASAEPAVAAAQGHFRARPGAGRAVRAGAQPVHLSGAWHLARSGAGDRPAARPVVDRAGAADAALGQ